MTRFVTILYVAGAAAVGLGLAATNPENKQPVVAAAREVLGAAQAALRHLGIGGLL